MINATIVFWVFVILFGMVGLMRAWQKEIIATASLVLAIFALSFANRDGRLTGLVREPVPGAGVNIAKEQDQAHINRWAILSIPFLFITFFGYLGPAITRQVASGRFVDKARVGLQEGIVGFLLGGINGYIIVSTLSRFAFDQKLLPDTGRFPTTGTGAPLFLPLTDGMSWSKLFFIENSALQILDGTTLIIALVVLFLFVIIVFI